MRRLDLEPDMLSYSVGLESQWFQSLKHFCWMLRYQVSLLGCFIFIFFSQGGGGDVQGGVEVVENLREVLLMFFGGILKGKVISPAWNSNSRCCCGGKSKRGFSPIPADLNTQRQKLPQHSLAERVIEKYLERIWMIRFSSNSSVTLLIVLVVLIFMPEENQSELECVKYEHH